MNEVSSVEEGINSYDVRVLDHDFCKNLFDNKFEQLEKRLRPDKDTIKTAQNKMGVTFGEEFTWILTDYGKLSYYYFDMLGLYRDNPEKSVMIRRTLQYRRLSKKLDKLFVIAVPNDAYAVCCDALDDVFLYSIWDDRLIDIKMHVASYIAGEGLAAEEWDKNEP